MTNYIVERRAAESEIWYKLSSTVKQTTYKATKLVAFKEYIFRVYAENQFGIGAPAEHAPITARYPFGMYLMLFLQFKHIFTSILPELLINIYVFTIS